MQVWEALCVPCPQDLVRVCLSPPFTQACAIRDPNSGYVFDLNPLNSSQGYVVSGIGKTFVVRIPCESHVALKCDSALRPPQLVVGGNCSWGNLQ